MQLISPDIFSRRGNAGCHDSCSFAATAARRVNREAVQTLISATRSTA